MGKKIILNDPNFMLRIEGEKSVPFKFGYTSGKFQFTSPEDNVENEFLAVGKIYLRVDFYNPLTGEKDDESMKIYLFDRIIK